MQRYADYKDLLSLFQRKYVHHEGDIGLVIFEVYMTWLCMVCRLTQNLAISIKAWWKSKCALSVETAWNDLYKYVRSLT